MQQKKIFVFAGAAIIIAGALVYALGIYPPISRRDGQGAIGQRQVYRDGQGRDVAVTPGAAPVAAKTRTAAEIKKIHELSTKLATAFALQVAPDLKVALVTQLTSEMNNITALTSEARHHMAEQLATTFASDLATTLQSELTTALETNFSLVAMSSEMANELTSTLANTVTNQLALFTASQFTEANASQFALQLFVNFQGSGFTPQMSSEATSSLTSTVAQQVATSVATSMASTLAPSITSGFVHSMESKMANGIHQ